MAKKTLHNATIIILAIIVIICFFFVVKFKNFAVSLDAKYSKLQTELKELLPVKDTLLLLETALEQFCNLDTNNFNSLIPTPEKYKLKFEKLRSLISKENIVIVQDSKKDALIIDSLINEKTYLEVQKDSLQIIADNMQYYVQSQRNSVSSLRNQIEKLRSELNNNGLLNYIELKNDDGKKVLYYGEVVDSLAHGKGMGFYETGSYYIGAWRYSKRNGRGKFVWKDGETYLGEYVDNKRTGYGEYHWRNGKYYKGEWKNDKRHGEGELFDKEGKSIYKGKWENDNFIKQ